MPVRPLPYQDRSIALMSPLLAAQGEQKQLQVQLEKQSLALDLLQKHADSLQASQQALLTSRKEQLRLATQQASVIGGCICREKRRSRD